MEADWTQPIIILAGIFAVFLWLRNDLKNLRLETRHDMQQLRTDMQQLHSDLQGDLQQLRADMQSDFQRLELKVDGLDSRLRAVESEQSRVVGLLEGLGLAGVLPGRES